GGDGGAPDRPRAGAARQLYEQGEKFGARDARTQARATVSLEPVPWGTRVSLKLGRVAGPQRCELVAVGRDGERQTVTTWAVPDAGYGGTGGAGYYSGGAAFSRGEIARFEVVTLDGRRLVTIKV
ncbi:hypothetical protein G5C65_28690, partial [Streptomyces sp. SB3404]|nr:hypothetical protein [Streptomyces boncukensis]